MKQAFLSYLVITSIFASASGTEFQVNTRPAYDQTYADIAMDANGDFVVVWTVGLQVNQMKSGAGALRQTAHQSMQTNSKSTQSKPAIKKSPRRQWMMRVIS